MNYGGSETLKNKEYHSNKEKDSGYSTEEKTGEEGKITFSLIYSVITSSFSSISFGLNLTAVWMMAQIFQSGNGNTTLSKNEFESLFSVLAIGALAGTLIYPYIKTSLKTIIIFHNFIYLGTLLVLYAQLNYIILLISRILTGFAIGTTCCVLPSYLNNISPPDKRGMICSFHSLGIVLGILAGQILSYFYKLEDNWQNGMMVWMSFSVIHCFLLFFIKNGTADDNLVEVSVLNLCKKSYARKSIIMAIVVHLTQQFSCINGIIYFTNDILAAEENSELITIFVGVSSVISTFTSIFFVEKFGRKILLLSSTGACIISLMGLIYLENLRKYMLYFFMFGFNFGLGPITWFVTGEIFPSESVKAGTTIACVFNWSANFITSFLFPILMTKMGENVFWIFIIAMICTGFYIFMLFEETKGREADYL